MPVDRISDAGDYYDIHGVRVVVESELAATTRQLHARLRRFRSDPEDAAPDLLFRFTAGSVSATPASEAISRTWRPVYDAPIGEVRYDDAEDRLHIAIPERIDLLAEGRRGETVVLLEDSDDRNAWLASHPCFTLALLEQLKRRNRFGVHAALLALDGRALMIAGTSGAGKSTLALCLLRSGFSFGGDDLCFLRPTEAGLRIGSFPDEIDVAEKTLTFFPELEFLRDGPPRPWGVKWPLLPEDVYPVEFVDECAPEIILFPKIGGSDESVLEPVTDAEALLEMAPNVILTDARSSQAHFDAIGALIRQSRCFRLTTGLDFDRLPEQLASHLLHPSR